MNTVDIPSLKLTAKAPENMPFPKGKDRLPTIHFQVLCQFQGGYIPPGKDRW